VDDGQTASVRRVADGTRAGGRRDAVIKEAARLFDERGYHATSMEDIAEAVGLRKPSLYHYFKSKDEILFWIHEEFIDLLIERQLAREAPPVATLEALRAVMVDILQLMDTHRGHVRVFFEHHRELPKDAHDTLVKKRVRYREMVAEIIRRGVDEGTLRDVDVQLATLALFGMCNWSYQWYQSGGPRSSEAIADAFCEMLMRGLVSPVVPHPGSG
jgi:TetR/AcrR family transcriptional regulator, cholesterol catabolism regulator